MGIARCFQLRDGEIIASVVERRGISSYETPVATSLSLGGSGCNWELVACSTASSMLLGEQIS